MNKKFGSTYKIKSNRCDNWDYSGNGCYFVTICTKNREEFFGYIIDNKMNLNKFGEIAHQYLLGIKKQFSFVLVDRFIIMPNHIHMILFIETRDAINRVSTSEENNTDIPNNPKGGATGNKNIMLNDGLGKIIRWYKGRVTFEIGKIDKGYFAWQPNYDERIIKDEKGLWNVRKYIIDNQKKRNIN